MINGLIGPTNICQIGIITRCFDSEDGHRLKKDDRHPDDFRYDVCLVSGSDATSFESISSPCPQWWTVAHDLQPWEIVQDTRLHIMCPERDDDGHDPAYAIDGKELHRFALGLNEEPPTLCTKPCELCRMTGP